MKDVLVPIDKAGRVVLPKAIRDELAMNPGDLLEISVQGSEVTLRPKKSSAGLIRRGKALVFSSGTAAVLNREAVEAVLAETREGLAAELGRQLVHRHRGK